MFNLLISYGEESWLGKSCHISVDRFCEYSNPDIVERYKGQSIKNLSELKEFPCLFVVEGEIVESRVGYITEIVQKEHQIEIFFSFSEGYEPIPCNFLKDHLSELDMHPFELTRTHWAIKDINLLEFLKLKNLTKELIGYAKVENDQLLDSNASGMPEIFVVHGQDTVMQLEVKDYLIQKGFSPIILHEQENHGLTIIEKLEKYTNVDFAVILYSPCDIGGIRRDLPELKYRARQNVVFEHGFLTSKLGRANVSALVKNKKLELPNDLSGLVYINFDEDDHWKKELARELLNRKKSD